MLLLHRYSHSTTRLLILRHTKPSLNWLIVHHDLSLDLLLLSTHLVQLGILEPLLLLVHIGLVLTSFLDVF